MTDEQINEAAREFCNKKGVPFSLNKNLIEFAQYLLSNQWISVEDELPEKLENEHVSDYVLVTNGEWLDVFRYDYESQNWLDYSYNTHWGITHWMTVQLPK